MSHLKPTNVRECKEVADAYQAIAGFFDYYALVQARKRLQDCMATAHSRWGCKGPEASGVLYFFEQLDTLMNAAFVLVQYGSRRPEALREGGDAPDLTGFSDYCGWVPRYTPWDYFPRHLSAGEYGDPYRALRKVATRYDRHEWKDIFRILIYSVLGRERLQDFDEGLNTHRLYLLLNKLLEATHLIEVRAITEVDGRVQKKWRGQPVAVREEPV